MLAIISTKVSLLVAARASAVLALLLGGIYHGGRYDTGGYGNDGVTQYHHYS